MAPGRWIPYSVAGNSTACLHHCGISNPAFRLGPPPPPILSSSSSGHRVVTNSAIAAVAVAVAVFFLSLTYYIVLVRRRRGDRPPAGSDGSASAAEDPGPDYHVWRIRTTGLDESAISSIAVKPFLAGAGDGVADCSVCLGELRDGELVRLLPVCGHAFHITCIDTWLREHVSCPLCRSPVFDPADSVVGPDGNAATIDRSDSQDREEDGGREGTALTVTVSSLDRAENPFLGASYDLPSVLQSGRRWNSIDSLPSNYLVHSVDREDLLGESRKHGSCSREDGKRSFSAELEGGSTSGMGKVLFFSRYGRARSSSVLPV